MENFNLEKEIEAVLRVLDQDFRLKIITNPHYKFIFELAKKLTIRKKEQVIEAITRNNINPERIANYYINSCAKDYLLNYDVMPKSYETLLRLNLLDVFHLFVETTDKMVEFGDMNEKEGRQHKKKLIYELSEHPFDKYQPSFLKRLRNFFMGY